MGGLFFPFLRENLRVYFVLPDSLNVNQEQPSSQGAAERAGRAPV